MIHEGPQEYPPCFGLGGWKVQAAFRDVPTTVGGQVVENNDMKHGLTHEGAWRLNANFVEEIFYAYVCNVREAMSNLPDAKPRDILPQKKLV